MKVEIWSDVVCPWCYIGKRRFESALANFGHRDQVEVIWRSYQLDPHAPRNSEQTVNEVLAQKYGVGLAGAEEMNKRVSTVAAQDGLEYHLELARHCNTFDAHRLVHLAAAHHLQDEMEERLFKAYFTDGIAPGETDVLVKLAAEVGINADEARAALESPAYAEAVQEDIQRARMLGIQGVPFYVFDEKYGVSGAQPSKAFKEVLDQVWAESHPLLKIGSVAQDTNVCDGDTCATS